MRRIFLMIWGISCGAVMTVALVIHVMACNQDFMKQQICTLPYEIAGCDLIVEQLIRYDGPFYEDGSLDEVTDVSALILRNSGEKGIAEATVYLSQEDRDLSFTATQISPGAAVLVLEKDGKLYSEAAVSNCSGYAMTDLSGWDPTCCIATQDTGMGSIEITNITDIDMRKIRLYYKTDYCGRFYIGGVTYEIGIDYLGAGDTVSVMPAHYASGSSKIVRILYETKTIPLTNGEGLFVIKLLKENPATAGAWDG